MEEHNLNTVCNYCVLVDFSEASYRALKYIISMAKITNGKIHICHIITESTSIGSETKKVEDKLNAIIEIITAEGIEASCQYIFGDIIVEFEKLIDQIKPDIVVIGKRKGNSNFSGNITDYLLNDYLGSLLIVTEEKEFNTDKKIAFAGAKKTIEQNNPYSIFKLIPDIKPPLVLISLKKSTKAGEKINLPKAWSSYYKDEYKNQFEHHQTPINYENLAPYIFKEKIELLCIGRENNKNSFINRFFHKNIDSSSEIIKRINIPILIIGSSNT